VTSPLVAPSAAAIAAVAAIVAVGLRERGVLEGLVAASVPPRRRVVEMVGAAPVVRHAAAVERLGELAARAAWTAPVERVAGTAALAAIAAVAVCLVLGWPALAVAPLLVVATLRAPTFAAARAARRRLRAIERDVPLLLDVLSLASFAGLPPPAALARAVGALEGPLADELSAALVDVDLGARWRDRLRRVADDLPIADLGRAIALLLHTESIGARSAEPITILADDVRAAHRAAATERARKAPVKMLFPLVFLVLPAFLLLTVVPVLVATLGSIR
jgi:tight adherence protein C